MVAEGQTLVRKQPLQYSEISALIPNRTFKSFNHPARTDGLTLKHWRKQGAEQVNVDGVDAMDVDANKATQIKAKEQDQQGGFGKYNIKVDVPHYTDDEYNTYLQDDDWTKEETDYLLGLCRDYDLRWIVITDRYDFHQSPSSIPDSDPHTSLVSSNPRTMEDLKRRYYTFMHRILPLRHPLTEMTPAKFALYDAFNKFDPKREASRKSIADSLLRRGPDDVKEEEVLLSELKRIVENEERFSRERRELYALLETPTATSEGTAYTTPQGLQQLLQNLVSADKSKKRRSLLLGPGASSGDQATGASSPAIPHPPEHRDSVASASGTGPRKASTAISVQQPAVRQLTPAQEAKYGVVHHERTSHTGVSFRSEKPTKLLTAKSNVQSAKLHAALEELRVPSKLVMPTEKTVAEFERLVQSINVLLDVRKVSEKTESEIRVMEETKKLKEEKERSEQNGDGEGGGGVGGGGVGEEKRGPGQEESAKEVKGEDVEMTG